MNSCRYKPVSITRKRSANGARCSFWGRVLLARVTDERNPVQILRLAWNDYRLDAIQGIVKATIQHIMTLERGDVLGRDLSDLERGGQPNPVGEALLACCEELRSEAGLQEPAGGSGRMRFESEPGAVWVESYTNAVTYYRRAAAVDLNAAFSRLGSS